MATQAESWENALRLIADTADTNQTVPDRNAVLGTTSGSGSDSTSWLDGYVKVAWKVSPIKSGHAGLMEDHDYNWKNSIKSHGMWFEVYVGVNHNKDFFTSSSDPYQIFRSSPEHILASPWQTNQFSPWSMLYASDTLTDVGNLLDKWTQHFSTWANDLDTSDNDWQGTAAGVFKHTLEQYVSTLKALRTQLASPQITKPLEDAQIVMANGSAALTQAADAWLANTQNDPRVIMEYLFQQVMASSVVTFHFVAKHGRYEPVIATQWGDPFSSKFGETMEEWSKAWWLNSLQSLDQAASAFFGNVDRAYTSVSNAIPPNFIPPVFLSPPGSGADSGVGGGGGPNTNLPPITIPPLNLNTGNSPNKGLDGLPNNGGNVNVPVGGGANGGPDGLPNFTGDVTTPSGVGPNGLGNFNSAFTTTPLGSGATDTVIGPGGQPVVGPDGQPLSVPLGSTISPDGTVIGPDGLPVTSLNGSPLTVPKGSSLTADDTGSDTVTGPDGQQVIGPDGQPLVVPGGSTVSANGTVLGPDGQPVLGPSGQPLTVPTGSSVTPIDTGGSATSAGSATSGLAPVSLSTTGGPVPIGPPTSDGSSFGDTTLPGAGSGLSLPAITSNGLTFPSVGGPGKIGSLSVAPAGGGGTTFAGSGGIGSPKLFGSGFAAAEGSNVAEPGSPLGETQLGAEHTADTADLGIAADESQALGRIATVGGTSGTGAGEPPIMPPMSGGGGGGGGAGAGGKKTWVTEDEGAWGTATSVGSGVIGR
jgi:hypothetical protein